jgi:hypothetical protein
MALTFRKLHPTFVGEARGVDLRTLTEPRVLAEIRSGMDEYGVLVFPEQPLTDDEHLAFAQALDGALHMRTGARVLSKSRFGNEALGDISNLGNDGEILQSGDRKRAYSLGNRLWHTDASFQDPPARIDPEDVPPPAPLPVHIESAATWHPALRRYPMLPRRRRSYPSEAPAGRAMRIRAGCWASSSRRRRKKRSRARFIR